MAKINNENFKLIFDYYQKGLSAREISIKMGVSIHAVYYFLRRNKIQRRSAKETNELRFKNKSASFNVKNNLSIREKELFIAGVTLYWAEGSKWSGEKIIDFANSDSEMVKVFIDFLRIVCGIDENKIRIYLYCYKNQDSDELMSYWSKLTKISLKQFTRPYIRDDYKLSKIDKMKHGLVHIRYYDKKLLDLMREWIKELPLKFNNMGR
ncbi:MAG: hypothetical protein WC682_05305 [Parcubacteria group bacterium]|jgi:hypothetical protein